MRFGEVRPERHHLPELLGRLVEAALLAQDVGEPVARLDQARIERERLLVARPRFVELVLLRQHVGERELRRYVVGLDRGRFAEVRRWLRDCGPAPAAPAQD